jgi:hypothetical protein
MNVLDEVNRTIEAGDQHYGLQRPPMVVLYRADKILTGEYTSSKISHRTAYPRKTEHIANNITIRTSLSRMSWQSSPLKPLAQSHTPCTRSQLPWFEHSAYTACD